MEKKKNWRKDVKREIFLLFFGIILIGLYFLPFTMVVAAGLPPEAWNRKTSATTINAYGSDVAVDGNSVYMVGAIDYSDRAAFVREYDSNGGPGWTTLFNESNCDKEFNAIAVQGERIYVVGSTRASADTDALIVCFSKEGDQLWNRTITGESTYTQEFNDIAVADSNSIYVAGYFENSSNIFALLVKYNSTGHLLWNQSWGTTGDDDWGYAVTVDGANAIYMCGTTDSFGLGGRAAFLARYHSNGSMLWDVVWGGYGIDYGKGIVIDSAQNLYITGQTSSFGVAQTDGFIAKFDSDGQRIWNYTCGESLGTRCRRITIDSNGRLYLVGSRTEAPILKSAEDLYIAKYDSSGNKIWAGVWGNPQDNDEVGYGIAVSGANSLYVTGSAEGDDLYNDGVLVKFDLESNNEALLVLIFLLPVIGVALVLIIQYRRKEGIFG
jgi:hypothetical protein